MKTIGITTTVPIEILYAAGYQPVDLNNILVSDPSPERLVAIAERAGFPLNCCSWIKGIYGVCMDKGLEDVLCVTTGDCSNTIMLSEVLKRRKLNIITFAYPQKPDVADVRQALEGLATTLGTTLDAAERVRNEIREGRELVWVLDRLTWDEGRVSGQENHYWQVSSSDFNQDYNKYCRDLEELLAACRERPVYPGGWLRLAYIGVPSVFARDLYPCLESLGARVVFNEVQRQFTMPFPGGSLADQYARYTYPYAINNRLEDIQKEIARRRVDGIIHYVQAFCHRGIGDIIFRDALNLPILTLEGNDSFFLTSHVRTRLEAFIDVLERRRMRRDSKV
ncbi:MAG: 2-hydroxyacyl-CoA dehydratase [Chloroflexota bacterium]